MFTPYGILSRRSRLAFAAAVACVGAVAFVLLRFAASRDGGGRGTVRVAAIQCYSPMDEVDDNRFVLTSLIEEAAGKGARIIVMPECAVSGYMHPGLGLTWTADTPTEEGEIPVAHAAETVPGPSTDYFCSLARRLGIYLCVALAERAGERYYNSQVLIDPVGRIVAHHRKRNLWEPGDGGWVTRGDLPIAVADTPYGRLGLMICYDVHALPSQLASAGVDVVLYSVGWYGPNTETWFRNTFPRRYVEPNGFAVVVANWSSNEGDPGWEGQGFSCVVARDGRVLEMTRSERGPSVVVADLPVRPRSTGRRVLQ